MVYNYDNMENLTASLVSDETFDESRYQKKQLVDGDLVTGGDPAYKLVTSENWQVVFPIDETTRESISSNNVIRVRFLKNDYESTARVEVGTNNDKDYGCLYLNDSMIAFATDRYVDIELVLDEIRGLKVPNSAIVNREFYIIPAEYATDSSAGDTAGFLRRIYLEGYADFTKINVINSNKEYSIVESESMYDLQVYDYIVLDGDGVNDSDFVTDTDLKNKGDAKK